MNIRRTAAAVLVAAGIAAIPSFADPGQGSAGAGQFRRMDRLANALNLTDAQKATARQLFEDSRKQAEPIVAQLKQNRTDLETAVKQNNTSAIGSLSARQGQLSGQLKEIRAKGMASFYAQLTPEQKAKAEELREQRHSRARNWRQNRAQ